MWIRHKKRSAWADWVWLDVEPDRFHDIRTAVRARYAEYVRRVVEAGEQLIDVDRARRGRRRLLVPLGFTANDFVADIARDMGQRVDFFNVRSFFQTVQTSAGDYGSGPIGEAQKHDHVMLAPAAGWTGGRP